ncbi:GIY-YIG nuclease family protein [Candidatus Omnitrophota bacterium]
MWYVYILKCRDSSFYAGITNNIQRRLARHNSGKASKYTRARRPVKLLYVESFDSKDSALHREIEIKSFSRDNKNKLIKFGLGRRFPSAAKI